MLHPGDVPNNEPDNFSSEEAIFPTTGPLSSKDAFPHGTSPRDGIPRSGAELLEACQNRSAEDSALLLLESRAHLWRSRYENPIPESSTQIGDLVLLPNRGTVYFLTDLEGQCEVVASLLDEERILERWRVNDPNDQVYLCILGDFIDRSVTGSLLVELLLELKCRKGLSREIIILPGNHELDPTIQKCGENGFFNEVVFSRESYNHTRILNDAFCQFIQGLNRDPRFVGDRPLVNPQDDLEALYSTRVGFWLLFNDIFHTLPKSIIGSNGVYASHAGFPTRGAFARLLADEWPDEETRHELLTQLSQISAGFFDRHNASVISPSVGDITWSDVHPHLDDVTSFELIGHNSRGAPEGIHHGVAFGGLAFAKFARIADLRLFIRGHQERAPYHSSVVRTRVDAWSYENIVTLSTRMCGGFAKLDLAIQEPSVKDVVFGSTLRDF